MRAISPKVATIVQPVELLDCQKIASSVASGDDLKRSDSNRFSQKLKPLRFEYKIFTWLQSLLKKTKARIEHGDLDVELDQRSQAVWLTEVG